MSDVHTCSYYCDRQACIKAQRDDLRDRQAALQSGEPVAWLCDAGDGANVNATCSLAALADYTRFGRKITPLYTTPQPVVDVNQRLVADKYEKLEPALEALVDLCNNLNIGTYDEVIAAEAALERLYLARKALLSAGKGGE